jgi:hypothetical protein
VVIKIKVKSYGLRMEGERETYQHGGGVRAARRRRPSLTLAPGETEALPHRRVREPDPPSTREGAALGGHAATARGSRIRHGRGVPPPEPALPRPRGACVTW